MSGLQRFEREARAASALNHPNIVSVHDIGREGGVSFIVSELVEGETLAVVIKRGPLPVPKLTGVTKLALHPGMPFSFIPDPRSRSPGFPTRSPTIHKQIHPIISTT